MSVPGARERLRLANGCRGTSHGGAPEAIAVDRPAQLTYSRGTVQAINDTLRIALALALALGASACKGNADDAADAGGADKAALEGIETRCACVIIVEYRTSISLTS